jgi:5-methylcytosine-specific restriction endonuclease McrA
MKADKDPSKELTLKVWARLVKERDGHRCQFEGCVATEGLEAHHILPRSMGGRNTLDNGITLCREHHRREYLRTHLRSQVTAKSSRLFAGQSAGKREAAYRFLSRKRLTERALPNGPWRPDEPD